MGFYGIRWDFVGILGICRHISRYARGATSKFALGLTIFLLFLLLMPLDASAVDLLQAGAVAPRQGILLETATSFRVLQVLEDYPKLQAENMAQAKVIARYGELEEIRAERENLFKERIAFLELQAEKWKQLNDASLQLAKDTRESQGSWWDKFRRDVGTFSLGAVFAIGVAAAIAF